MNKQRQSEEAAKIDGHTVGDSITFPQYFYKGNGIFTRHDIPDYHTDFNAVHRLIVGMDDKKLESYLEELGISLMEKAIADGVFTQKQIDTMGDLELASECVKLQAKATCAQMLEAVLRAYGVWEEA